jgi:YD repeat-containing protein
MTQTTTTNTNTSRRAHPAVVRAALRSRNTHRFEYNKLNRMVKEIRPLGQTIAYTYDINNVLTQVTAALGQVKQYVYDDVNRRTQENHYLDAAAFTAKNAVKSITYTYNTLGRLTGYNDGSTIATYTYDAKQLRQTGQSVNYASINGVRLELFLF